MMPVSPGVTHGEAAWAVPAVDVSTVQTRTLGARAVPGTVLDAIAALLGLFANLGHVERAAALTSGAAVSAPGQMRRACWYRWRT